MSLSINNISNIFISEGVLYINKNKAHFELNLIDPQ